MSTKNIWSRFTLIAIFFFSFIVYPVKANNISDTSPKPTGQPRGSETYQPGETGLSLHLAAATFDPLARLPLLPESLSYTEAEAILAGDYIVQFSSPVLPEWKEALVSLGVQLGDYIPDYAFLAHMDASTLQTASVYPFVRWIGAYQPAFKLARSIDLTEVRSYRILVAPWADAEALYKALSGFDGRTRNYGSGFSVVLNGEQVIQTARQPGVIWIEPYHLQSLHNDIAGGDIMGGSTAWSNGYTGTGIGIAVTDTGLDTGDPANIHLDFSGRVAHISSWPVVYANYGGGCETSNPGADDGAGDTQSGHGTHVTGSVAGDGAHSAGQFKGLAYEASINFQAVEQLTEWTIPDPFLCPVGYYLSGIPDDVRTLLSEVYGWGARVQNNSWGGGDAGVYDTQASYFDDFIYDNPDMAVVVSAGNSGVDNDNDGYVDENSIKSPGTGKNLITIGASDNERTSGGYSGLTWTAFDFLTPPTSVDDISDMRQELAAFSSRGPLEDGRIKPDLVAPGTDIISTRSSQASGTGWGAYNSYYMYNGGTSMASPLSAGAAALVREYYITAEGHANPSAALIKATLINSAVDISGYGNLGEEAGMPIPNNHEGWGLIDVAAATTPGDRQFVDDDGGIGVGATDTYSYSVTPGTPFKVSLVWSDYPGSPIAAEALVNDLNLRVTAPDGTTTYRGNRFSGGWSVPGGGPDHDNNVENVYIQAPAAGIWRVDVTGANVPQNPQGYALVVDGDISPVGPLSVTSITPNRSFNNDPMIDAIITGTGFEPGASVQLRLNAEIISGTNIIVDSVNDQITADFDLSGHTPGLWDVIVNNLVQSAGLTDGFTLMDATLPELEIQKVASSGQVSPGDQLTYTITIQNRGVVSATGVVFTDTLPEGLAFISLQPACEGGLVTLPDGFACAVQPVTLPPGDSITYALAVEVTQVSPAGLTNHVDVAAEQVDAYPPNNNDDANILVGYRNNYLPLVKRSLPVPPSVPTLNPISNSDQDGTYTISWQAGGGPTPTSYDIEENGTVILSSYVGNAYNFTGKAAGTYAYRVRGKNAGGAGAWSNTQSTTVAPTPPPTPIRNGGFENGQDGSWIELSSNDFELIVDAAYLAGADLDVTPHNGNWAVWLGGWPDEVSSLIQQVTIPQDATTLSFWYWAGSEEAICGEDIAQLLVNSVVVSNFSLCLSGNTGGWALHTIDLGAYANQSVSLEYQAQIDSDDFNSNFFLDDVTLE